MPADLKPLDAWLLAQAKAGSLSPKQQFWLHEEDSCTQGCQGPAFLGAKSDSGSEMALIRVFRSGKAQGAFMTPSGVIWLEGETMGGMVRLVQIGTSEQGPSLWRIEVPAAVPSGMRLTALAYDPSKRPLRLWVLGLK